MADDSSRSKLVHLLQPIRSLSDNWDVNIAAELEDYLEELEELTFAFEGGPSLNFAEAALVIQGSACIYGRKVEYLHGLVYRALEVIADNNKRRQNRTRGSKGGGDDDGGGDPEADFLCLDSLIEVGSSIDLDEDVSKGPTAALRPPPSLLALEDAGGNSDGTKGGEDGVFKISYCHVHASGALLLEQQDTAADCDQKHRAAALAAASDAPPEPFGSPAAHAADEDYGPGGDHDDWEPADDGAAALEDGGGGNGGEMVVEDGSGGEVLQGGDEGLQGEESGTLMETRARAQDGQPLEPVALLDFPGGAEEDQQEEEEEEPFDPYQPLDMYDSSSHKPKPFRRMRARKLLQQQQQPGLSGSSGGAFASAAWEGGFSLVPRPQGCGFSVPAAAVNGCTYPEFSYILEALRAAAPRRSAQRSAAAAAEEGVPSSCFTAQDAMMNVGADEEEALADDWEPMDDFQGDGGADDADQGEDPLQDWGAEEGGAEESYWTQYRPGDPTLLEDGALEGLTYEELCKAHIDKFIAKAAKAEVQSELASRVAAWQSKMEPALEIQNSQGAFDIHEYGELILTNLSDAATEKTDDSAVEFNAVVVDMEKHQVSRAFSAMLQLINNGNVAIHKGGENDAPFTLELVTTELAHKQMGISGALGFHCNGNELPQAPAAAAETRENAENVDANVQQGADDDGRSPLPKAAKTASSSAGAAGRTDAAKQSRRGR